jgi:glycosyltransferase involved in cell wall biosynthesis
MATKISAYIPCHNAAATVLRTIESIEKQSVAPSELFVVDDGSLDRGDLWKGLKVIRY